MHKPYILPILGMLLIWAGVLGFLFMTPWPRIQAGSVEDGWTQVGNGTRLQYVDLEGDVRCYRMRYSSNLDCLKLP